MSKARILCPECKAPLNIEESLPAGKKIKCPKCQVIFPLGERLSEAVSAEPMAVAVAADADDGRDVEDDRPARRRGSEREKQGMGAGMTVGLIAASVLVAGGLAVGTYFLVKSLIPSDAGAGDQPVAQPAAPQKWQPTGLLAKGIPPELKPPKDMKMPINPNVPKSTPGPQVGQVAPEIVAEDLDGQTFKLSDYRGKVVLLDFWGHW
jgi:AhpC/TSA family